jgi:hypothetical protein
LSPGHIGEGRSREEISPIHENYGRIADFLPDAIDQGDAAGQTADGLGRVGEGEGINLSVLVTREKKGQLSFHGDKGTGKKN